VLHKDTGQREGENKTDLRKREKSEGPSRKQSVFSFLVFWKSHVFSFSSSRFWRKSYPAGNRATTDLVESPDQGHTSNRLRSGPERNISWLLSGRERVY